jgi:Wzt C-terminal domain
VLPQGRRAVYRARIRFETALENPVFGVIVKAENGEHVFVTNTMLDGVETGSFAAGEEAVYTVEFDLLLAEGRCTASPAVAHQDAQRFADWWEDGITFAVRGEGRSGGLVDLPHEARIERAAPVTEPVDA